MRRKLISLVGLSSLLALLLVQAGFAKEMKNGHNPDSKVWRSGWHTAGLLHLKITNYGMHGYENACEWPAGSGDTYIFGAGIWVGCISSEGDTLVSVGYNPYDGSSEFVPGDLPNEEGYTDPDERIYWSDNPDDLAQWPVVVDGDTIVVSSQDSWCQFNDYDTTRHSPDNPIPIGVRVTQTGYSWDYNLYQDFIFLTYEVVNISGWDISGMYLGVACDADIGDFENDTVGFDSERNLGYACTSRPPGGDVSGYIGYDFLESPLDSMGEELGLTAFKIFTRESIPPDPGTDGQRYMVLAGYNYLTGEYQPFDEATEPSDYRFIQCTGPFDLAADDTARVVVAVIAGEDLEDLQANSDLAQNLYDQRFKTHEVTVLSPNGGEELAETVQIRWEAISVTGNPLTVDISCSRDRGVTWMVIATGEENDSSYAWDTSEFFDGTNYLIKVVATDGVLVGEDKSDRIFTVNNPGNGVPDIILISPNSGELSGKVEIAWEAADADGDPLFIGLFYSTEGTNWTEIATGLENDSSYSWNTYPLINGSYLLKITASDAETTSQDISDKYLTIYNDHRLLDYVTHLKGGCNTITIFPFEHKPEDLLTDHDYRITFNPIQQISSVLPLYTYNLYDITIERMLLYNQPLNVKLDGNLYTTWSPIVDGFSLKMDTYIDLITFNFVSFEKVVNNSGCDAHLSIIPADEWCFRGSDYELRWRGTGPDSLTLEVWDLDNDVAVPYAPEKGDTWGFLSGSSDFSPFYRPGKDWCVYLCGGFFVMGGMSILPEQGDIWMVTAAGDKVPCEGNVYSFHSNTPVEPTQAQTSLPQNFGLSQNYPNPFNSSTVIGYQLSAVDGRPAAVTLKIYNILGQLVKTLVDGEQVPGYYSVNWDGRDSLGKEVSSGVYFCRLEVKGQKAKIVKTRKMMLLQ